MGSFGSFKLKFEVITFEDFMEATESSTRRTATHSLEGARQHICYGMARVFLNTPLRRFGFRCDKYVIAGFDGQFHVGSRCRVSSIRSLAPFMNFEGKVVMDLGCNRGICSMLSCASRFQGDRVNISSEAIEEGEPG